MDGLETRPVFRSAQSGSQFFMVIIPNRASSPNRIVVRNPASCEMSANPGQKPLIPTQNLTIPMD